MIVDISPPWVKPAGDSTKYMIIFPIHLIRTNWVRASCSDKTKYSIAHTSKHVTQRAPQHTVRCKIHLRHRTQMVEQNKLFASARMPSTRLHTKHWETRHPLAVGKSEREELKAHQYSTMAAKRITSRLIVWPRKAREVTHAMKGEYWKTCSPSSISLITSSSLL